MGRTSEISYEAVATVCTDLAGQGKRPTFALIKGELGGSYEVLKRHMDRWQAESAAGARYALPNDLATELGVWYQRAKGQAQAEADIWLDQEKALLLVKEQHWQKELDAMKVELAKANEQCAQMGHDLSIKALQSIHAIEKAESLSQAMVQAETKVAARDKENIELTAQLAVSVADLHSERQRHTRELELAEERTRGTEKAILMRHHAEVELQKEKAKLAEKQLEDAKFKAMIFEQRFNELKSSHR
jgi:Plasmid replication region DNA-binding N-term